MGDGRMRRVDEAVRAVLSEAIATDLSDPRVGFVTVTAVKTSPDLRHARVYVSILGDARERDQTLGALQAAHGFLQGRLAAQLPLKHTPQLVFHFDESIERGMRITQLLDEEPPRGD
jgi:ribosome-binding factor A